MTNCFLKHKTTVLALIKMMEKILKTTSKIMFQKSHFCVHVKVLYNSLSGHNILTSFVLEENLCWEIALFTSRATPPPLFHMDFRWQFRGIRYYGNKIAKSIASKAFLGYFSLQNSTHFDVVFRPASNSTHYLWVTFFWLHKHYWNNQIQQDFLKIWLQKYLQNKAFR